MVVETTHLTPFPPKCNSCLAELKINVWLETKQNNIILKWKQFYEFSFRFQRSNRQVDDLLSHGQTILESLRDQRVTLKGIQVRFHFIWFLLLGWIEHLS